MLGRTASVGDAGWPATDPDGRPFVAINCTALPEELVESELFGHVACAFSGAQRDRIGRFELASRGTLFFDEVGDLSMSVQPKLLRALQERVITRVGDTRDRKVDARLVGATNALLTARIAQGRFREDLFFRLSVFTIPLPRLRERTGDVPLLAEAFVKRFAAPGPPRARRRAGRPPHPGSVPAPCSSSSPDEPKA